MKRWIALSFMGILACVLCMGCTPQSKTLSSSDKLQVYTTIYPLEYFAKRIGGSYIEVKNVVPLGIEPHDFEPTAQTVVRLSQADVVIYNGAGLEGWIEKLTANLDQTKTQVVNTTEGLSLLEDPGHEHHHGHGHAHESDADPHVWLDPNLALQQAVKIKQALIQKDRKHQKEYEQNFDALAKEFNALDREFSEMSQKAVKREFVTSHAAFAYLAKRYHLVQIPITGVSPMDEPSPKKIQEIINTMKKYHINVIFFETLGNGKMAEAVRRETGAEALMLNPLEGLTTKEQQQGADYFSMMRENKKGLVKALGTKK